MLKDDFLHYLIAEKAYSAATVKEYDIALSGFGDFVEKQGRLLDWTTIEDGDIREWIVSLMDKGSAASTVNTWLSALRSFYRYLLSRRIVEHDPTLRIEGPKKKRPLPYFIKESEMDRLLDDVDFGTGYEAVRDHMILQTFYSTGIRLAELVGLNVVDLDFGAHTLKVTGKRNKQRIIPMGQELEAEARAYLEERRQTFGSADGPLFLSKKGARISRGVVEQKVKHYLSLVTTQKKRSPHVLRHSFATAMLNHGAEISVVKELLGHESLATTEIYTHTTFEELKKIYNNAHPRA
jgi:integrase/recombinase XerC